MNKQIKFIAVETLNHLRHNVLSRSDMEDIQVPDVFIEKFAELIVRECIKQGKQVQSQTVSNGSEDYNEGRKMGVEVFMNQIKKHFGVK